MLRRRVTAGVVWVGLVASGVWLGGVAMAAQGSNGSAPAEKPLAQAMRVQEAPVIDGDVLNDAAWASIDGIEGFWQITPNEGQPASERTVVKMAYTANTLYIGVIAYDRTPSGIIVSDSRRDSPLDNTDSFQIILDTYRDTQNGFVFGTNPAGLEYDGQVTNEGAGSGFGNFAGGGRQFGGSGGGFNINWDGAWQVRTVVADFGWSAEFAIPFRTLRYPAADDQRWGLNFQRNIRRRNETVFWSPLPRQFNLYRLSEAGALTGLQIPAQRNFKVSPYVLSQVAGAHQAKTTWDADVGFDAKYGVTPSLTLDATVNTDFAQVEVDDLQINLDRFSLFFPEKRPFFLENAGLFSVGNSGQAELFFSRRIGIGPNGIVIPIRGGGRLSGKAGDFNVGFLNMQTAAEAGVTAGNNFSVARVARELPNRSRLGGIFVNRIGTGSLARSNDYNQTYGFDGRWGVGRYGLVDGWIGKTHTPGRVGDDLAFKVGGAYNSERWRLTTDYSQVERNFNPEVGFLRRSAYRSGGMFIFRTVRFQDNQFRLHEWRPHVMYRGTWGIRDGLYESGQWHIDQHLEWKNSTELHTGMNLTHEGVRQRFEISPGVFVPTGQYDHSEAQIVLRTNEGNWISFNNSFTAGGFFGGDRFSLTPTVRMRAGDTFNAEVGINFNDVSLPWGDFQANLYRTRLSYSFTPRMYTQALLQYNSQTSLWSTNLRFGWLQDANTGIFVVYNDTQDFTEREAVTLGRSLTVKFSRMFDVLR
ncbi:MAG: DUF5916 domain-containing protein [Acidobacteriota bacterium]